MKQLLTLMLCVLGVAYAEPGRNFNKRLQDKLLAEGYDGSRIYTIAFRVSKTRKNSAVVKLADNYYIVNQRYVFWGLNNRPDHIMDDRTFNKGFTFKRSGIAYRYDSEPGRRMTVWTQQPDGCGSGARESGEYVDIVISCDGTDTKIVLRYEDAREVDTFVLNDTALNIAEFRVDDSCNVTRPRFDIKKGTGKSATEAVQDEPQNPETGLEFNVRYQQELKKKKYEKGNPFSVSFRLSDNPENGASVVLDTDYYIVNQRYVFWGLNDKPGNDMNLDQDWTFSYKDDKYQYTAFPGKKMTVWTQSPDGRGSGKRGVRYYVDVVISSDGESSQVRFSYDLSKAVDTMVLPQTVLDATKIHVTDSCKVANSCIEVKKKSKWRPVKNAGRDKKSK